MDVVYVYKKNGSLELDWSLKSLKNIKHRNVYIVGDQTDLDAIHVQPMVNKWSSKSAYHDQINKMLTACWIPELSEDFILMNDDFFVLEKWEPENYHRGDLDMHIKARRVMDAYSRSLMETKRYLEAKGLATNSYELHTPFVFNKNKLSDLILGLDFNTRTRYQIRSIYGNTYSVDAEYRMDVKNPALFQGLDLISTNERTFLYEIGDYIREMLA